MLDRCHARRRWRGARLRAAALSLALALGGCAQVAPRGGFSEVQAEVARRGVAQSVSWHDGSADDRAVADGIRALLERDLTPEGAVQIALLQNPSVQSTYEELGIAQASLVQAGLLKNPVFSAAALFGSVSPAYDFDVAQTFLDALLIPARQRIAAAQFGEARLRVAGEVFDLTARVREAYYRVQGALQVVSVLEVVVATTEASLEFAERLHAAGNVSALAVATERALHEEMRAELLHARAAEVDPREDLRRLLGLSASEATLRIPAALPGLPAEQPPLGDLLALARSERLELGAAREESAAVAEMLETARFWRYLGGVEIGAEVHREQADRNWIAGPTLAFELPLFDQRQADLARLESELRRTERRHEALALDVAAEVRRTHEKLRAARTLAEHYRDGLIPARERVVALAQQFYDFMLLGTPELLLAKRAEIEAYRDYVAAVRDYWIAVAALERAVGTRLPIAPPSEVVSLELPVAGENAAGHAHHRAPSAPPASAVEGGGGGAASGHSHGGH